MCLECTIIDVITRVTPATFPKVRVLNSFKQHKWDGVAIRIGALWQTISSEFWLHHLNHCSSSFIGCRSTAHKVSLLVPFRTTSKYLYELCDNKFFFRKLSLPVGFYQYCKVTIDLKCTVFSQGHGINRQRWAGRKNRYWQFFAESCKNLTYIVVNLSTTIVQSCKKNSVLSKTQISQRASLAYTPIKPFHNTVTDRLAHCHNVNAYLVS